MKLPNKRAAVSRSMSTAMRSPVLRDKNFVQSRAATQRFIPENNPRDYERLANAQMRAAEAGGKVGLAFADMGIRMTDAAIQVDNIQQQVLFDAKEAKLRSWIAGKSGDAAMQDLAAKIDDGSGRRGYEVLKEEAEREYKAFRADLDKEYGITNYELRNKFANTELGLKTAFDNQLNKLIRGAENERSQITSLDTYSDITTMVELDKWRATAENLFTPQQVTEWYDKKTREIGVKAYAGRIDAAEDNATLDAIYAELEGDETTILTGPEYLGVDEETGEDLGYTTVPSLEYEDIGNLKKMVEDRKNKNVELVNQLLTHSRSVSETKVIEEEAIASGNIQDYGDPELSLRIWRDKVAVKVSSQLIGDAQKALTFEHPPSGRQLPIDDPVQYARVIDGVMANPEILDEDKVEFESILRGEVTDMHLSRVANSWVADQSHVDGGTMADVLLADMQDMTPEQLGLAVGDEAGKDELLGKTRQYLAEMKANKALETRKLTDAEKKMALANSIVSRRVGMAPNNPDLHEVSDIAFAKYVADKQGAVVKPNESVNPLTLEVKFAKEFGVAPTTGVNNRVDFALGRGGTPEAQYNALKQLLDLYRATDGGLENQSGLYNKKDVQEAIDLAGQIDGLTQRAAYDLLANRKGAFDQSTTQGRKQDWEAFSPNSADAIKEYWETYAAKNEVDAESLSAGLVGLVQEYLPDAFMRYGNTTQAMMSAFNIAFGNMGIENGEWQANSLFALSPYADKSKSDDNKVLKTHLEDIAEISGVDYDEVGHRVILNTDNTMSVAYYNKETGMPLLYNNQDSEYLGKQIITSIDELSPRAEAEYNVVNATEVHEEATADYEASQQNLGEVINVSKPEDDIRTQNDRKALVAATQGPDAVEAATAKAKLDFNDSQLKQDIIANSAETGADPEEAIKSAEEAHVAAARAKARKEVERMLEAERRRQTELREAGIEPDIREAEINPDMAEFREQRQKLKEQQAVEADEDERRKNKVVRDGTKRGAGPNAPKTKRKSNKSGQMGRGSRNARNSN